MLNTWVRKSGGWLRAIDLAAGKALGILVKVYQVTVGVVLPSSCRFVPTCSQYTLEALRKFGIVRGSLLGGWRILRCNPWSAGGYDPVPMEFRLWVDRRVRRDGVR